MQFNADLLWANLKAFAVSWLSASLLFPLFAGADYSWGLIMMLLGIIAPHVLIPSLVAVALVNWIAAKNRKYFTNPASLVLLGGLVSGITFLLIFLVGIVVVLPFSTASLQGLLKIVGYLVPGGGIFGFYYYFLVVPRITAKPHQQTVKE